MYWGWQYCEIDGIDGEGHLLACLHCGALLGVGFFFFCKGMRERAA